MTEIPLLINNTSIGSKISFLSLIISFVVVVVLVDSFCDSIIYFFIVVENLFLLTF